MNVKMKANTILVKLASIICYFSLVATENGDELATGSGVTVTDPDIIRNSMTIATEYVIGNLQVEKEDSGVPSPDTGLYLMSREDPSSGRLKALRACGFLLTSYAHPPWVKEITLTFQTAGYQLVGNSYERHTDPYTFYLTINVNDTFGCDEVSFPVGLGLMVSKGDRTGVFIQRAYCNQFAVNSPLYTCPAHVNMIDPVKNCSQALYFNSTRDDEHIPDKVNIFNGNAVGIFINLDLTVEADNPLDAELLSTSTCAKKVVIDHGLHRTLSSFGTLVVVAAVGVTLFITIAIVAGYCRKRRVKKGEVHFTKKSDLKSLPQCTRDGTFLEDATVHCANATILDKLQYNDCYGLVRSNNCDTIEPNDHPTHMCMDSLNNLSTDYVNEELYWDPASHEEDIKKQLTKLKVENVHRDNIELKEYLGSGQFGIVYHGLLTVSGVDCEGEVKEVAVKTMENGASEEQRIKFLQEAAIMGQFNNSYIIKIYGVLTSSQPYMIICELMNKGDLRRYLHTIKISGVKDTNNTGAMLLSYSRQVASAMVYLSGKGYIHRDLAARNILLSVDGVCKISDFGLSRDLQDKNYYVAQSGLIPLRWTAPEALQDSKFSTASDVWSYGVILFELWSLASKPYGNLKNQQVWHQVLNGYRLPSPPGCPRAIYKNMVNCWHPAAVQRPMFTDLQISLQQPDYELLKWSDEDKETYSENARTIGATFQDGEVLFRDLQNTYNVGN